MTAGIWDALGFGGFALDQLFRAEDQSTELWSFPTGWGDLFEVA